MVRVLPSSHGVYAILGALAPQVQDYLCIGVQEGECLRHVVTANPRLRSVILCDTWGNLHGGTGRGSHEHIDTLLDNLGYIGTRTYLDGSSQKLVPRWQGSVDLSYVDGSHELNDALADLQNVWPRTRSVMVVHDVRLIPNVKYALDRFLLELVEPVAVTYHFAEHGTAVVWRLS